MSTSECSAQWTGGPGPGTTGVRSASRATRKLVTGLGAWPTHRWPGSLGGHVWVVDIGCSDALGDLWWKAKPSIPALQDAALSRPVRSPGLLAFWTVERP
jgi:hypothetical protein